MSYITHILKNDTQEGLVSVMDTFLAMNAQWVTTGQIQYNEQGNYYYQGVIQTGSENNNYVIMALNAILNQIVFDLQFYSNTNIQPVVLINGMQQKPIDDFTINDQQLVWTSKDFALAPTDDIRVAFTFTN